MLCVIHATMMWKSWTRCPRPADASIQTDNSILQDALGGRCARSGVNRHEKSQRKGTCRHGQYDQSGTAALTPDMVAQEGCFDLTLEVAIPQHGRTPHPATCGSQ
jgi:hypothetical protein